jgi:hypothetical protein
MDYKSQHSGPAIDKAVADIQSVDLQKLNHYLGIFSDLGTRPVRGKQAGDYCYVGVSTDCDEHHWNGHAWTIAQTHLNLVGEINNIVQELGNNPRVAISQMAISQIIRDILAVDDEQTRNIADNAKAIADLQEVAEALNTLTTEHSNTISEYSNTLADHQAELDDHSQVLEEHQQELVNQADAISSLNEDIARINLTDTEQQKKIDSNTSRVASVEDRSSALEQQTTELNARTSELEFKSLRYKGVFADASLLPTDAMTGDYAYVGTDTTALAVYTFGAAWAATGEIVDLATVSNLDNIMPAEPSEHRAPTTALLATALATQKAETDTKLTELESNTNQKLSELGSEIENEKYVDGVIVTDTYISVEGDAQLISKATGNYKVLIKRVQPSTSIAIYTDALFASNDSLAAFTDSENPLDANAKKIAVGGKTNIQLSIGYNNVAVPENATFVLITLVFADGLGSAENKFIAVGEDYAKVKRGVEAENKAETENLQKFSKLYDKTSDISREVEESDSNEIVIEDSEGNPIVKIGEHNTSIEDEEVIFCNESEDEEYVKIGEYGLKAKDYKYADGAPVMRSEFYKKRVLFFGDSLVAASQPPQQEEEIIGFVERIAAKNYVPAKKYRYVNSPSEVDRLSYGFKNIGKDGTTLRINGEGDSVCERVKYWVDADTCDLAIIQGGTNDFNTAKGVISESYDITFDTTTTIGALEEIFRYCTGLGVKVAFLIMPKVGYVADNYYDDCKAVCKKWGIPYLDLTYTAGFYMSYDNVLHGEKYSIVTSVEYDSSTNYMKDDKVRYNGASYKCISDNTKGVLPTNSQYWTKTSDRINDFCHLNNLGHRTITNKVESFIKSV